MNTSSKESKTKGFIAFYDLGDWWLSTFTDDEKAYIDNNFRPMGMPQHSLTQGDWETSKPASQFLNGLATWFGSSKDASISERIHAKVDDLGREHPIHKPGYYNGRHYTTYVSDVENLKKNGRLDKAEILLLELVEATESESKSEGCGVAPWYYEELAKIYRRQKLYTKEVAILERFATQKHAPGVKPPRLLERLKKAKEFATDQLSDSSS